MVRLSIGPVGGCGYGICFGFKTIHPTVETIHSPIEPVDSFAQHLMSFDNNIQLMLKILSQYANMVFTVFRQHRRDA
jgi:hypothetical protein